MDEAIGVHQKELMRELAGMMRKRTNEKVCSEGCGSDQREKTAPLG